MQNKFKVGDIVRLAGISNNITPMLVGMRTCLDSITRVSVIIEDEEKLGNYYYLVDNNEFIWPEAFLQPSHEYCTPKYKKGQSVQITPTINLRWDAAYLKNTYPNLDEAREAAEKPVPGSAYLSYQIDFGRVDPNGSIAYTLVADNNPAVANIWFDERVLYSVLDSAATRCFRHEVDKKLFGKPEQSRRLTLRDIVNVCLIADDYAAK